MTSLIAAKANQWYESKGGKKKGVIHHQTSGCDLSKRSPGSLRMQVVLQLLRPLYQNYPTGTRTVAQVWLPPLVIALKEG